MKYIKTLLAKVLLFFTGGKAAQVFETVAELVPKAIPIVNRIAELTPNKTDDEIAAAFAKYGQEFRQDMLAGGVERGYLLLQLATRVLAVEFPSLATNILNSAIQLAVTGQKAS